MCGIAGFVSPSVSKKEFEAFHTVLQSIAHRGPDMFGATIRILSGPNAGQSSTYRIGDLKKRMSGKRKLNFGSLLYKRWLPLIKDYPDVAVIANFRAIPTTEHSGWSDANAQPFLFSPTRPTARAAKMWEGAHVVHNGQLHNDKDLKKEWGVSDHDMRREFGPAYDTDSFVIGMAPYYASQSSPYREIKGSFAYALLATKLRDSNGRCSNRTLARKGSKAFQTTLELARNYRGLYLGVLRSAARETLMFSSELQSLEAVMRAGKSSVATFEMPMNSNATFNLNKGDKGYILKPKKGGNLMSRVISSIKHSADKVNELSKDMKTAVVLSGGLDSTVVATMACEKFSEVHLIHYQYGAKAQTPELQAFNDIYDFLRKRYPDTKLVKQVFDLSFIKKLGGSVLTQGRRGKIAQGERGVETANEWVPARNTVMIAMAAAYCDRHGIGSIQLGLNEQEAGVHRDNSVEFYTALDKAVALGTKSETTLLMPLGNMVKHHIWAKGMEVGAPLHLSWSCYEGGKVRCGRCGPCLMRKAAAIMNNQRDDIVLYVDDRDPKEIVSEIQEIGEDAARKKVPKKKRGPWHPTEPFMYELPIWPRPQPTK